MSVESREFHPEITSAGDPTRRAADGPLSRPGATLADLTSKEQALLRLINDSALPEALKTKLRTRFQEDIDLAKNSSLSALDDNNKDSKLGNSAGLVARQQATKDLITADLSTTEEANKAHLRAALAALEEVHQTRQSLLQKALNNHNTEVMDEAFDKFKSHMGVDHGELPITARADGMLRNSFAEYKREKGGSFESPRGIKVTMTASGARSNDPEALALAMIADGHKDLKFGGHPQNALLACEVAFARGADNADLDKETLEILYNTNSTLYNTPDFIRMREQHRSLKDRFHAKKIAKDNTPNTVFNEGTVSPVEQAAQEKAIAFAQLDETARKGMLAGMSTAERVQLAAKPANEFTRSGVKMDGHDYVRALLNDQGSGSRPQWQTQNQKQGVAEFDQAFARLQTAPAEIAKFKAFTHATEAGRFMGNIKTPWASVKFHEAIKDMGSTLPSEESKQLKLMVKAACIGSIIDRYTKGADLKVTASSIKEKCQAEVASLLRDNTLEERNEIMGLFQLNYNRVRPKLEAYNANVPAEAKIDPKAPPIAIELPAAAWLAHEGPQQQGTEHLINNQAEFERYRSVLLGVFAAEDALTNNAARPPVEAPGPLEPLLRRPEPYDLEIADHDDDGPGPELAGDTELDDLSGSGLDSDDEDDDEDRFRTGPTT